MRKHSALSIMFQDHCVKYQLIINFFLGGVGGDKTKYKIYGGANFNKNEECRVYCRVYCS